ncbi:MAG TPA: GAF domain-containing protein, partial [Candidatus Deferrimicrobiaceae bacterium]
CLLACGAKLTDAVLAGLRGRGVDVADALQHGNIVAGRRIGAKDMNGAAPEIDILGEACRLAASEGYPAVRVLLRSGASTGAAIGSESVAALLDPLAELAAGRSATVLCVHEIARFLPEAIPVLLRAHSHFVHGGRLLENFHHIPAHAPGRPVDAIRPLFDSLEQLARHADQVGKIRRQSIRLARIRNITLALMTHTATNDLLAAIADGVTSLGYRLCWIGMARPDGSVEPVAVSGDRSGYLRTVSVRWDDTAEGRGPVGAAIRKGERQVIRDVVRSRRFRPWREAALARSFLSVASIPLRVDGRTVGVLSAYASERNAFDADAVEELSAFALQASLAFQRDREHRRLARSEERLRRMFEQIPAACFTFDREGRLLDMNVHCRRIFANVANAGVGTPIFDFLETPESVAEAKRLIPLLFAGKTFSNLEWVVNTGRGARRLLATVSPYRGASETVELGIGVGVDLTGLPGKGGRPGDRKGQGTAGEGAS